MTHWCHKSHHCRGCITAFRKRFPNLKLFIGKDMALRNFWNGLTSFAVVHADDEEELVDPQTALREQCQSKGHIGTLYSKYQACNDRVNSRSKTTETCMEELFDYVTELDHCVAHTLFSKLK